MSFKTLHETNTENMKKFNDKLNELLKPADHLTNAENFSNDIKKMFADSGSFLPSENEIKQLKVLLNQEQDYKIFSYIEKDLNISFDRLKQKMDKLDNIIKLLF